MRADFAQWLTTSTLVIVAATACAPAHAGKEKIMVDVLAQKPRLQRIFNEARLVCFGRYALEVPVEAELLWGSASFPSTIEVLPGGLERTKERMREDIEKLKRKERTFELVHEGSGPSSDSFQIRYYEDKFAKNDNALYFKTYVMKGDLTFVLLDSIREGETQDVVVKRQAARVNSLRLREPDEVPVSPGYCVERGFMGGDFYSDQEMVAAGLYIPSLPDVTFSISSNKDAYADYKKADFERMKREELGLLARIKGAMDIQGKHYPKRTVLREGKRTVQHWLGEESLVRRADGTHDFEWAFVGTPTDVANPSEFGVQMYTKVAHNTVGAAARASLTDAEAIALWDKLLSGLKFRVKVPGAPTGSYYSLPGEKPEAAAKP